MSEGNRGKLDDHFITDYYSCNLTANDLPVRKLTPDAIVLQVKLSFVVAWLKKLFCDAEKDKSSLVFPPSEVYLERQSARPSIHANNEFLVTLEFGSIAEEEEIMEDRDPIEIKVEFYREDENLTYAVVHVEDDEKQCDYYSNRLKRLVERELEILNEHVSHEKLMMNEKKEELKAE